MMKCLTVFLFLLNFLFIYQNGQACSCIETTLEEKVKKANFIFTAKVVNVDSNSQIFDAYGQNLVVTKLKLLKVYKGDIGAGHHGQSPAILSVFSKNTSCDFVFNESESYLVFEDGNRLMSIVKCNGSKNIKNAKKELEFLKKNIGMDDEMTPIPIRDSDTLEHSIPKQTKGSNKYYFWLLIISSLLNVVFICILILKRFSK